MPEWFNSMLWAAGLFVCTLILVRLMGKGQAARLTYFDLVNAMVIGFMAAALALHMIPNVVGGFIALAIWTLLPLAIRFLSIKYKVIRDLYQGKETVLVNHGKVLEDKLMEVRLTPEDLLSQLRKKNVFSFADVEFAVLEPSGEVSVLLKKEQQPATPKTLGINVANESVPQTVIMDGEIIDEHLTALGFHRGWLQTELKKAGVALENVFIAQVDAAGQLYLDTFDDAMQVPKPQTKELIWATLRKAQADFELYALGTKNNAAKRVYEKSAHTLADSIIALEPLLKR